MLAKGMIQPAAMAAITVKTSHILSLVEVKVNNLYKPPISFDSTTK